jgi:hypothetical protein
MNPKDYSRREFYYRYRPSIWNPTTVNRLREDIAEQAVAASDLMEAKMVIAYIMQKR